MAIPGPGARTLAATERPARRSSTGNALFSTQPRFFSGTFDLPVSYYLSLLPVPPLHRRSGAVGDAADVTLADFEPRGPAQSCTQVTTGVCSAEFLASVFADHHGVMIAFCNDKFLVVQATGEIGPKFDSNLNDIPFPPGKAGTNFVTGQDTRARGRTSKPSSFTTHSA